MLLDNNRIVSLICKGLALSVLTQCFGCSAVSPWERGNLAKEEMAITPHPNREAFRDHIFTSKEASQGGHGGSGGGCGCN
ncbi:DUF4266 domain-containing protein [Methylomonas fluvii]|uniref:DUF4266 domain-containing protein n=1 Tax=Methylomonas fluvii TaxID=1854564 RepID=A0ABR9DJE1_9GAMM|nr:DUF4266 domain-containing protein [Methylomonas fluvii]MBD9363182.1 DUF4266 domain-containing protein [Methylomonas fluvii]